MRLVAAAWHALVVDAPFFVTAVVFVGLTIAAHEVLGYPMSLRLAIPWSSVGVLTFLYALVVIVVLAARATLTERESLLSGTTWRLIFARLAPLKATVSYVLVFLMLGPFMHSFIAFKAAIPEVVLFRWDVPFMKWDRILHFGIHPFVLLQPLLGAPPVTALIDDAYFLWNWVMWFTIIWQAWHGRRDTPSRSRFLLSFALCWILLGVVAATFLSSAGPVYYGEVVAGEDPYTPLFDYLARVHAEYPLHALWLKERLWTVYMDPQLTGLGISAMPSLHVAIAVLMALLGFSVRRWIGWAYTAFAVVILLGSVHLGWHYAIDGYVSIVATIGIWWAAGRVVLSRKQQAHTPSRELFATGSPQL